jgi:hypothetical protein
MAAVTEAETQLQHATGGSVEYVPSQEAEMIPNASESSNSRDTTIVPDAVPPQVSSESVSGEALHTRPKTLKETTTGTIPDGDVVQ